VVESNLALSDRGFELNLVSSAVHRGVESTLASSAVDRRVESNLASSTVDCPRYTALEAMFD
jgi:hypothetical protein